MRLWGLEGFSDICCGGWVGRGLRYFMWLNCSSKNSLQYLKEISIQIRYKTQYLCSFIKKNVSKLKACLEMQP